MKASVIIPNWNGAHLLSMCLDSLGQSSFDDFEALVVDNGSDDASCALIRERYPQVRLIELDRNYGFARACNEGIRASTGEFVVLLNNDIEVAPDWLEQLILGMARNLNCSMGASRMMYRDQPNIFCNAGDGFLPWGAGVSRGEGETDSGQYDTETEVFGACAGAAIYKRSLFDQIGLFDESFHSLAEDVDLNARARLSAHRAIYFPKARIRHIGSATLGRYSDRYVYLAHRNESAVLLKNFPLRLFLKNTFAILRQHIRTATYFSYRGQGRLLWKAKCDAVFKLFSTMKSRRDTQSLRKLSASEFENTMSKSKRSA